MDSSELNKYAGAVIGALLLFLLLGFFSSKIYGTSEIGHHGDEVLAFALEIEAPADGGAEEAPVSLASLAMEADPGAGEKVFNACRSCHQVKDGANGIGPHLWGVVGREIAAVDGFTYSNALAGKEGVWDLETLSAFLENPSEWAPGTNMSYRGLRDAEDRVNLIAYLNEEDGTPIELAAAPAEQPAAEAPAEAPAEQAATEAPAEQEVAAAPAEQPAAEAPAEAPAEQPAAEAPAEQPAAEAPAEQPAAEAPAEQPAAEAPAEAPAEQEVAAAPAETPAEAPAEQPAAEAPASSDGTQMAAAGSGIDWASGDADNGKKIFRQCMACHQVVEGRNGVGPHLYDVIGRDIAAVDGFRYSDALQGKDGVWTGADIYAFIENPREWAPGTKMAYPGLRKSQDRIDVITYLNEVDGSPEELK